jgi:hypothetical protein
VLEWVVEGELDWQGAPVALHTPVVRAPGEEPGAYRNAGNTEAVLFRCTHTTLVP